MKQPLKLFLDSQDTDQILDDCTNLIRLARPLLVPLPEAAEVRDSRQLIRHASDVPALLSALADLS